jgi:hypothetical protein
MTTREKVVEIRKQEPNFTLKEIGIKVGISRERVRQILKSESLSTTHIGSTYYKLEIIKSSDVPLGRGHRYDGIREALQSLTDEQALKITEVSGSDVTRIRFLLRSSNYKVITRKGFIYISKENHANPKD